uniref:WD_REPEATS_REGION domain-containing protein n=1 Tax=Elaeophora elaphi TaxID=1147741 RepID=A0A0R3RW85_9BILA
MGANNAAMNLNNRNDSVDVRQERWTRGTGSFVSNDPYLIESALNLRQMTAALSGAIFPELSVQNMLRTREMGRRERPRRHRVLAERNVSVPSQSGAFSLGEKASIINKYLPNQRTVIETVNTKTFCCLYLPRNRIVTASQDDKLRFYARQDHLQSKYTLLHPTIQYSVPDVGWSILDITVNSVGNQIAYSTWSDSIHYTAIDQLNEHLLWNTFSGTELPPARSNRFAYFSLRYNMDDKYVIAGGSDGFVYLFSSADPRCQMFPAHKDDVNAICCSKVNPDIFCTGSDDGLCKVWDIRLVGSTRLPVGVFAGHRDGITYIDSHGNDRYILTNSKDQSIKIWDLRRFSSSSAEKVTLNAVRKQRWDYRYQQIPPIFQSVGPLQGDGSLLTFRGHSVQHTLIRTKFSPERTGFRYIYTGSTEGNLHIYDILTGEIVRTLDGHRSVVRDCCWHPDENEIITVSWDGVTARWYYNSRCDEDQEEELDRVSDSNSSPDNDYDDDEDDDDDDNNDGYSIGHWSNRHQPMRRHRKKTNAFPFIRRR